MKHLLLIVATGLLGGCAIGYDPQITYQCPYNDDIAAAAQYVKSIEYRPYAYINDPINGCLDVGPFTGNSSWGCSLTDGTILIAQELSYNARQVWKEHELYHIHQYFVLGVPMSHDGCKKMN